MTDQHGRFVWYELLTTDLAAAREFYSRVVGWQTMDAQMSGHDYWMFTAGGKPVTVTVNCRCLVSTPPLLVPPLSCSVTVTRAEPVTPGDSVKVDTPGGKREFEIVKLFTIHDEAAG